MKIAILETGHFQYTLTQAEIFAECDITVITTESMKKDMLEYSTEITNLNFFIINTIAENEKEIVDTIQENKIDMLLISPVFDSYGALKKIVKKLNCKKVVTIHNINTWFYHRFWSPNSFLDRVNMKAIISNCDYIAVEDFIYNHLKSTNDILYQKYKFIYIPFTLFHERKDRKYKKDHKKLKIVLTGAIDGDRRKYEEVIEVINFFANRSTDICFSFAGRAKGEYGLEIQKKLAGIKSKHKDLVFYFDDNSTADMFRYEMETSDLVLSTSTVTFNGMGTIEYIGKTKPTAAIHDMMSYELPGLLPSHLLVPANLVGSGFNYKGVEDLKEIIGKLLNVPELIEEWKLKARQNSLNLTAKVIRKGLPF